LVTDVIGRRRDLEANMMCMHGTGSYNLTNAHEKGANWKRFQMISDELDPECGAGWGVAVIFV
jgi:hypothetical protein